MTKAENIASSPNSSNAMLQAVPFSHGSLFSGIGGFDLAASWMGWTNVFQVEKDEWCRKVLAKNFPSSKQYSDIKEFSGNEYKGTIDIISGGFPCQPFSSTGKRKGNEDERHLWPEMLRTIREIQPRWVVGENVYGIINWNKGLVFHQVQTDLEAAGYEVFTYILPACAVNAIHRRDRVWFVAYANGGTEKPPGQSNWTFGERGKNNDEQKEWREQTQQYNRCSHVLPNYTNSEIRNNKIKPGIFGGNNGLSNRMDRIRGLGNAIVPAVALEIFKAVQDVSRHCL